MYQMPRIPFDKLPAIGGERGIGISKFRATLATTTGDINIIGSNAVSTGDMNLNAANNLNIISAQNTAANENHSRSKAIGNVVISDTERFMGYHSEKANNDNQTVTQVSSNVGSLAGNVNATAGKQYTQIASNVVAGNDINVTAKDIQMLTAQNTGDAHSDQSALKIGVFARVSSPIIDLVNNIDAAHNSDGRLQAMQGMAAAGNAYQAGSAVTDMLTSSPTSKGYGSGNILKAEVGIGVSSNKSSDNSTYSTSVGNTLTAGNNIHLTSTDGNIHAQQTDMTAGNTLALNSAKDILLDAGQSTVHTDGQHSNYGAEIGVGVSVGAQTGVYAYAQASAGKGSYNTDTVTNSNTHLVADNIQINSKGDTTLKGATATANSISTDVGGTLTVQSLQDTGKQTSSESGMNARVQVSFGSAWEVSGGVNASKGNGDYAQVTEQSGLFAGEGGYHVKAQDVSLIGGAITSTNAANSELTAQTFQYQDIQNHMNYSADSVGLSGSIGSSGYNDDKQHSLGEQLSDIGHTLSTGDFASVNKGSFAPGLPVSDSGSDSSTTRATLTEGNITIGGQSTTATATGVNTDASVANTQVANLPDLQQLLKDQQAMVSAVTTIQSSVTQAISDKHDYEQDKADQAKTEFLNGLSPEAFAQYSQMNIIDQQTYLMEHSPTYNTAFNEAALWGTGGDYKRAADAVTAIITGVGSGQAGGQVATNALAPYAAQLIGNAFDSNHGNNPNQAAQILSHAVLGAVLAYANGGNAATGAMVGGGSEAAAQYLIRELYPEAIDENGVFSRAALNETQAQNIVALTNAIGAVVGGIGSGLNGGSTTDVLANAAVDANVAKNAVENNYLTAIQNANYEFEKRQCGDDTDCLKKVEKKYDSINLAQDKEALLAWKAAGAPVINNKYLRGAFRLLVGGYSGDNGEDLNTLINAYNAAASNKSELVSYIKTLYPWISTTDATTKADEYLTQYKQGLTNAIGNAKAENLVDNVQASTAVAVAVATTKVSSPNSIQVKIEPKIASQMSKRGWTESSIKEVVSNPAKTVKTVDTRFDDKTGIRLNEPATGYIAKDGSYVVINNKTGNVVQVSDKYDPNWKTPW